MRRPSTAFLLFVITVLLVGIGLVMVYSSSASYAAYLKRRQMQQEKVDYATYGQLEPVFHDASFLRRQATWAGIGLVVMMAFYWVDHKWLKRLSVAIMLVALVLLLLVFVPGLGIKINGARRWLDLNLFYVQPSEFAKLALVIYMAKMLFDRQDRIRCFMTGLMPALVLTMLFAAAIGMEPDLGAAVVLCAIVFGMWFIAGMKVVHLAALATMAVPAVILAILMEPWRVDRVIAYLTRDAETMQQAGYQLKQALIALGSGGLWGKGLGESLQKYHYLTAAHSDFIFAIQGEELGFIRTAFVVALMLALLLCGWRVASKSSDLFCCLLASGITLMIAVGICINLGVVVGLLPTKGLALPFISYGGSSLVVNMAAVGILMNLANRQDLSILNARPGSR